MLNRFASQFIFCSPFQILNRSVVEHNNNIITRIFSLNDGNVESAQTLFVDGVISIGIVSVKLNSPFVDIAQITEIYNYIDVTTISANQKIIPTNKPLLLDFGTENIEEINFQLSQLFQSLNEFSAFEIIAACTYYPSILLNLPSVLAVNIFSKLTIWESIDLVKKKMTNYTRMRQL